MAVHLRRTRAWLEQTNANRQRRGTNSGTSNSSEALEEALRVTRGSMSAGTRDERELDCGRARVSGWSP